MISSSWNCSIKLASGHALKKLIESLISDAGAGCRLKHTPEWAVLASLDEYLDEGDNCRVCLGCLEYDLVNRIFLKFIDSLRLCIAAMAFGGPPSQVWATDGSYR
jgi:hypothetical protein